MSYISTGKCTPVCNGFFPSWILGKCCEHSWTRWVHSLPECITFRNFYYIKEYYVVKYVVFLAARMRTYNNSQKFSTRTAKCNHCDTCHLPQAHVKLTQFSWGLSYKLSQIGRKEMSVYYDFLKFITLPQNPATGPSPKTDQSTVPLYIQFI